MTKAELLKELEGIPDDAVVCLHAQFGGEIYEASSIEYQTDVDYYDIEDVQQKGNVVTL
jgi:hypothetical protein